MRRFSVLYREKRITIAERKNDMEKQALYDAYVESERSLDEIIDLIRNADEWI